MESYGINILVEAKNEYTKQLTSLLTPKLYEKINKIFYEALTIENTDSVLKNFQYSLKNIPDWNENIIKNETKNILDNTSCNWFEDLLTAVFVSNTRILTSVQMGKSSDKIKLEIPTNNRFIHTCFIECAREFYKNPYLFDNNNLVSSQVHRNLRDSLNTIENCISNAIRKLLPFEQILKKYLGNGSNNSIDNSVDNKYLERPNNNLFNKLIQNSLSDDEDDNINNDHDNNILYNKDDQLVLYDNKKSVDSLNDLHNLKESSESLNNSDNIINDSDNNIINDSDNKIINNSDNNIINDSDNNIINDLDNNIINDLDNNIINDSDNNIINDSDNNIINDSDNKIINESLNNLENNNVFSELDNITKNKSFNDLENNESKKLKEKYFNDIDDKNDKISNIKEDNIENYDDININLNTKNIKILDHNNGKNNIYNEEEYEEDDEDDEDEEDEEDEDNEEEYKEEDIDNKNNKTKIILEENKNKDDIDIKTQIENILEENILEENILEENILEENKNKDESSNLEVLKKKVSNLIDSPKITKNKNTIKRIKKKYINIPKKNNDKREYNTEIKSLNNINLFDDADNDSDN